MRPVFRKLKERPLLYESIVRVVEEMVLSRTIGPGDGLPAERELATQFAVSRTAVREAMKVLAEKGLVTVRHGKAPVVAHPSASAITASLGTLLRLGQAQVVQLAELRRGIEPEMAALAAARATPEAVRRIETLFAEHQAARPDRARMAARDMAFHCAIAEAAGNVVAEAMLKSIGELFLETILGGYQVRGAVTRTFAFHSQILSAIRAKDPVKARQHMWAHMDDLVQGLSGVRRTRRTS